MSSKQPPIVPKRHSKTSAQLDFGVGFVVPFIPPEPSAPQSMQSVKLELQQNNKAAEVKCLPTTTSVASQISNGSETKRELQTTAGGKATIKTSATNNGNSTGRNEPFIQLLSVEPETNQSNRALTNAFRVVKELFTTERNFLIKLFLLEFVSVEF